MIAAATATLFSYPVTVAAETPSDVLVIAETIDDIVSLDPQEAFEFAGTDLTWNVYERLVGFDTDRLEAGYQPSLAESWTVSDDGRTFIFRMRPDVLFHSGNPVTAHDAAFSLQRAVKLQASPAFILTQFGFTPENVDDRIQATSEMTLSVTTDRAYAVSFVLNCLTANVASVVDRKLVLENEQDGDLGNGWLKTNSAGSGPYVLQSWKPSESYSLLANDSYRGGAPAMRQVIVRHIAESATQRLLLERGDIDIARKLGPEDVEAVTDTDGLAVDSDLRGRLMYFAMSQKNPVLKIVKVREALKYLVDYEGMADSFLKGQYVVHQSFLPRTFLGEISDTPYSLNIDKARQLLAEAGHGDGFSVNIIVRNAQERVSIAESLQNTFAQAGIEARITTGTGKQVLGQYRARAHDIYVGAWGPDYPDPQTNAGTFAYNGDNGDEATQGKTLAWRNSWETPQFNPIVTAAVVENDRDARAAIYRNLQREHQKLSPFAIMFQRIDQIGRQESVTGFNTGAAVARSSYWTVQK